VFDSTTFPHIFLGKIFAPCPHTSPPHSQTTVLHTTAPYHATLQQPHACDLWRVESSRIENRYGENIPHIHTLTPFHTHTHRTPLTHYTFRKLGHKSFPSFQIVCLSPKKKKKSHKFYSPTFLIFANGVEGRVLYNFLSFRFF
jgi:hypothetical protein